MDLDLDLFKIESNNLTPAKGRLLISEPFAQDAYFKRSVVLITEHNDEGTMGFILNKPVMVTLQDLITDFPSFEANISLGGPVSTDSIHFVHCLGDIIPESQKIIEGLFWGGDFESMKQLLASGQVKPDEIRFFLGYSGWSPKQLAGEIDRNAWLVSKTTTETVLGNTREIWSETLRKIGGKYELWPNFPENPKLN